MQIGMEKPYQLTIPKKHTCYPNRKKPRDPGLKYLRGDLSTNKSKFRFCWSQKPLISSCLLQILSQWYSNACAKWDPFANPILRTNLKDSFCVPENGPFLDVSSKCGVTLCGILNRIAPFLLNNWDGHFYRKIYLTLKWMSSVKGTRSA